MIINRLFELAGLWEGSCRVGAGDTLKRIADGVKLREGIRVKRKISHARNAAALCAFASLREKSSKGSLTLMIGLEADYPYRRGT